jgi:hypothetical protein
MLVRIRIFTIALLALFAAGIIVHSAGATSMSLKMALGDAGVADMADCQGCGTDTDGEDTGPTCEIVCTVSFAASPGQVDTAGPDIAHVARPLLVQHLAGRTGPPEPYPPRILI